MPDMRSTSIPTRAAHVDMRRNNLEVVLRHLWAAGTESRADIAVGTGLTRATVSRLVTELNGLGLVEETGTASASGGGQGRPSTQLVLGGRHVLAIGAAVGTDHITVLVVDLGNRRVYRSRRALGTGRDSRHTLRLIAEMCEASLSALPGALLGRAPVVAGLGVAVPGLVDEARGVVSRAPNLEWEDVPVADVLRDELGSRVGVITVGNDANRAALAEYRVGGEAGSQDLVYVSGDVGVGGGLIVQGRPLAGARGYGGEVGHMTVHPEGPRCGCGRRGCWEAFVGLNALQSYVRSGSDEGGSPEGAVSADGAATDPVAAVRARAEEGDEAALAALTRLGRYVGIGAANIGNIVNPEVIVLGGYFAELAPWILPAATRELTARLLDPEPGNCRLVVSELGFTAAARGAATDIVDRVMNDPLQLIEAPSA